MRRSPPTTIQRRVAFSISAFSVSASGLLSAFPAFSFLLSAFCSLEMQVRHRHRGPRPRAATVALHQPHPHDPSRHRQNHALHPPPPIGCSMLDVGCWMSPSHFSFLLSTFCFSGGSATRRQDYSGPHEHPKRVRIIPRPRPPPLPPVLEDKPRLRLPHRCPRQQNNERQRRPPSHISAFCFLLPALRRPLSAFFLLPSSFPICRPLPQHSRPEQRQRLRGLDCRLILQAHRRCHHRQRSGKEKGRLRERLPARLHTARTLQAVFVMLGPLPSRALSSARPAKHQRTTTEPRKYSPARPNTAHSCLNRPRRQQFRPSLVQGSRCS